VKEEEGEMFPLAKKSELDLDALGKKLMARKEELAAEAAKPAATQRRSRNGTSKGTSSRTRSATKSTGRKTAAHGRH
jgi:hypothetical protein